MMRAVGVGVVRRLFLGIAVTLAVWLSPPRALACDGHGRCWPTCPRWVEPPTQLATGSDPEDLKIHIEGPYFDTIEVFFQNQFYRETFPNTAWLQYGNCIALAPKNPKKPLGTFAVLHGCGSSVKVYGWTTSPVPPPKSMEIPVDMGCPVTMQWVTDRILKVRYGPGLAKETIVRFDDATPAWTQLYP